ncbi:MAG: dipeptide epimerase [Candidatus Competibacteraceae bacterium]|nr:dipeptide epimerase [Candidatus Competibacteraceae bacterium]
MKITRIVSSVEHLPLARPYTIAFRTISAIDCVLVELHTDQGRVGLGTASPEPYVTGETETACQAALGENSLDWLVGQDVRRLPALCRALRDRLPNTPAARAALDMALHDLLAQYLCLPLVEMLGRVHERLPTSVTIGIKSVRETLAEAEERIGTGFRALKIKLGHSLEEDLERLHRLRERFGETVTIRVDPNQGYSAVEVLQFVERSTKLAIEFLEQPMPVSQLDAMRALPEPVRARLAADECLLNENDALGLLMPPRACGIFNIKLMKWRRPHPSSKDDNQGPNAGGWKSWLAV